ncbi:hypothetical protein MHUMG1_09403 [Metarhizium humberi]|uniref:Aminoglycoside phosphotransferase domain-containing protein n=1 Tax=Metarhizium humberi TaxID=2596975 RepID=A0A9P8S424_9HYPO|nr:hypothetical protein MHUMG1_09403 [Metarhizium humberi]
MFNTLRARKDLHVGQDQVVVVNQRARYIGLISAYAPKSFPFPTDITEPTSEAREICSIYRLHARTTPNMVTNQELNDRREPGCTVVLADKKYFHVGNWFMKRTLREHEWQSVFGTILIVPPRTYPQRWKNDAAILRFLRKETDIPLPPAECTFEDDRAFYFQSQYIDGIRMEKLAQQDKEVVMKEIERHVTTLQALRSDLPGVPGESLLCPPGRVTGIYWKVNSCWRPREKGEYVFCHNDLREHNVIVDPETLKIRAIINWEFGGFWPAWFERPFWKRRGLSMAAEGEEDDVE